MRSDAPVILEIGFNNLIAEVIFRSEIDLLERADVSHKEIGEGVAAAHVGIASVKS